MPLRGFFLLEVFSFRGNVLIYHRSSSVLPNRKRIMYPILFLSYHLSYHASYHVSGCSGPTHIDIGTRFYIFIAAPQRRWLTVPAVSPGVGHRYRCLPVLKKSRLFVDEQTSQISHLTSESLLVLEEN